jgi:hypothetical protein
VGPVQDVNRKPKASAEAGPACAGKTMARVEWGKISGIKTHLGDK